MTLGAPGPRNEFGITQGAGIDVNEGTVHLHFDSVRMSVHWNRLLVGLAVLLLLATAVWGGRIWWEANRDLDVTSLARLEGDRPTPVDGVLTLRLDGPPKRSHLRLTLALAEGRPKSQLCLPDASVAIRSDDGTAVPETALTTKEVATALNGKPVVIPLAVSDRPRLLLTVKGGPGCHIDVGVARMVLTND
ncbi:hypothetical protein ACIA8O_11050 [Kitasatospora sp. NPDC051853]|uniref:hypothetical protein n=1 Tax=Kitasatospora sp. NPDC051853 TaxID=3364058 RepID=UPI0037BB71E4